MAAGFATLARQRGWQRVDADQRSEVVTQECQAALLGHAARAPEGRADG